MTATHSLAQLVAPLRGQPCWGVKRGHGSFLTFEFGEPGPHHGAWHLWVYCCDWRASAEGAVLARSDAPVADIDAAARRLDGQRLLHVQLGPLLGESRFVFERGLLETQPYDDEDNDEQWMLYRPDGLVFTLRADGLGSLAPGSSSDEPSWLPVTA